MRTLSYQAETQIQYLYQLVRSIAEGSIQLPRFLRPYVWTEDQQIELFRSVATGTPIGAIMLWRTDSLDMKCYEELGPYKLRSPGGAVRTYIIDGHQRLATIFGALHVPPPGAPLPEQIAYYDLEAEDFMLASCDEPPQPLWLPLRFVFDFSNLLPFQRSLVGHKDGDMLIRRMDRVTTAFGEYKFPIITIVTNDLDQVTRTFQMINSQGTALSAIHMISALTWSKDFDLNNEIDRLREESFAPLGWADLDDDIIFRAYRAVLGLPLYGREDVNHISQELARHASEVSDAVALILIKAIEFLGASCGIRSPKVIPYPSHIVSLADAIHRQPGRERGEGRDILVKWFWSMAYSARRIAPEKQLEFLERITSVATSSSVLPLRLNPLLRAFDFRRVRCRTLALRLSELGGTEVEESLGLHGSDAVPRLLNEWMKIPQQFFESPANRIVVNPARASEERRRIRDACAKKKRTEEDLAVLRRHAISPEAADAYAAQNLKLFYELRLGALETLENDFAGRLGLLAP